MPLIAYMPDATGQIAKDNAMIPELGKFDPAMVRARAAGKATGPSAAEAQAATAAAQPVAEQSPAVLRPSANMVLRLAAEGAPVDQRLVREIRTAIAEGRYPLDPNKIAAAMIAVDLPPAKA